MLKLQSRPRSWQAREEVMGAILRGDEFTTGGSLRAEKGYAVTTGLLPWEWVQQLRADNANDAAGVTYVVYSYATPIAWFGPGVGWRFPEVGYSLTTSQQQGIVRSAMAHTDHVSSLDDERLR